eukprot:2938012-Ditylum_brightwellii.AAC.1
MELKIERVGVLPEVGQRWIGQHVVKLCVSKLIHAAKIRAVHGGMYQVPTVKHPLGYLPPKSAESKSWG